MSQTSDINTELLSVKTLTFDNKNINDEHIPLPINEATFGIFNIKAISSTLTKELIEFVFMVDCSGSMSDPCSDGRNKMQHIVHTLKNMILYFKENPSIKVHITINSFDDKIYKIVERCAVTDENYAAIMAKIDKIVPRQSTDIELALKSVRDTVTQLKTMFPENNIVNIFMTDGDATAGETRHEHLAQLVDRTVTNAFIGFGLQHDATLLSTVSNGDKSAYYFIDKLENSGMVYGEILHGIVYKLLKNVEITVQNGLVYDYKNNLWLPKLCVGEIVSEADKFYHIASSTTDECLITLTATNTSDASKFQISVTKQEEDVDLSRYIYRQRTLQHLYIVGDFLKRKNIQENQNNKSLGFGQQIFRFQDSQMSEELKQEKKVIGENLYKFIEEMKAYMAENNLNDDKFMKNLCDDIFISYRTFGTRYAAMYNTARQTSQGTQRCYTVSHTPQDDYRYNSINNATLQIPKLRRQVAGNYYNARDNFIHDNEDERIPSFDDLPPLNHVISDFEDTPYLTPGSTQLMREISIGRRSEEHEEEEEEEA
jgi:AraC-like DNA-binding protein